MEDDSDAIEAKMLISAKLLERMVSLFTCDIGSKMDVSQILDTKDLSSITSASAHPFISLTLRLRTHGRC